MNMPIIVNPSIRDAFSSFAESGRVLLFSAPCGFGKTTLANALLRDRKKAEVSAETLNSANGMSEYRTDGGFLLIDNLQLLTDADRQRMLCEFIRDNPKMRFVLLTRGVFPGWLMPFRFSGLAESVDMNGMFFTREMTSEYFSRCGLTLSDTEFTETYRDTRGYPLALSVIARRLADGERYCKKLSEDVTHEIFLYYEEVIFRRFDLPMRRFLLDLAPFDEFGTELARMASGDNRAGEYLSELRLNTGMFAEVNADSYRFHDIFARFLLWELERTYTDEQRRTLYSRGGLYYELHENYSRALSCYSKSGESDKVSEILVKNAALHPGSGHFEELEPYYDSLSDAQIKSSPALMQGMSMLCAIKTDYEGSERWYGELKSFAAVRGSSDAAAKEARGRLAYLDISLPQRGVGGLAELIVSLFKLIVNKEIKIPPFSVTSTLPSIMNGGKDFSDWSKTDDFLYATVRLPVEALLGRDGVGLPDCAITESKFEKGLDVSSRMLTLVSKISEVQTKGTPDIEFALVGLLARSQTDSGRAEDAVRTVTALRERFEAKGLDRFFPNIDALLCRLSLCTGDRLYTDEWYRDKAPRDGVTLKTLKRYQYLTRAMVELSRGDESAALLTLAPLVPYCRVCEKHIDTIHLRVLSAIAKRRAGDCEWRSDICEALGIAAEYGFVRTVGEYGAAVLPLITECGWDKDSEFLERVVKCTRSQAVFYPDFLKPPCDTVLTERLTESETQVLRLLCADKSNAEIGEILDIKLATVKSHVSHILQKLGVSRRSEAKTAAHKLRII